MLIDLARSAVNRVVKDEPAVLWSIYGEKAHLIRFNESETINLDVHQAFFSRFFLSNIAK